MRKVIKYFLIFCLVLYVVSQPEQAADTFSAIVLWLVNAAEAVGSFVSGIEIPDTTK